MFEMTEGCAGRSPSAGSGAAPRAPRVDAALDPPPSCQSVIPSTSMVRALPRSSASSSKIAQRPLQLALALARCCARLRCIRPVRSRASRGARAGRRRLPRSGPRSASARARARSRGGRPRARRARRAAALRGSPVGALAGDRQRRLQVRAGGLERAEGAVHLGARLEQGEPLGPGPARPAPRPRAPGRSARGPRGWRRRRGRRSAARAACSHAGAHASAWKVVMGEQRRQLGRRSG